jgi:four helix bundle protein
MNLNTTAQMEKIKTHKDLKVYHLSFEAGMEVFEISKLFPKEERYSLTDQIRRSSRSVSGNLAEAFRKRRYPKYFVAKLTDSEGEAAETQVWLDYALACNYIEKESHFKLFDKYDHIIAMIVNMSNNPDNWTF